MNGPFLEFQFEKDKSYPIPAGYRVTGGSIFGGQFQYSSAKYLKHFSVGLVHCLMFVDDEGTYHGYIPTIRTWNNAFKVTLDGIAIGKTEQELLDNSVKHFSGNTQVEVEK